MFPVQWKDATLMSLCNDSSFHFNHISRSETERKLKEDGDYLIQRSLDGESLLLSSRPTNIHEFSIYIMETPTNITLNLGRSDFHTFDDLVDHFKKDGIRNAEDQIIKFSRSMPCTKTVRGRFGAEFRRDFRPRCPVEAFRFDLGIPNPPCRLVAVRKEISAIVLDDELEKLVKLRHENVVSLLDFEMYGRQSKSRLVLLRNEYFDENLYDFLHARESQPLSSTCKWIKQAAEAMSYLNEAAAHYTLVCAQDSYLDAAGNLKIGGSWMGKWSTMIEDTVISSFYWRKIKDIRKTVDLCNRLPDSLNRAILGGIGTNSEMKLSWNELAKICKYEHRILSLVHVVKKFLPFA